MILINVQFCRLIWNFKCSRTVKAETFVVRTCILTEIDKIAIIVLCSDCKISNFFTRLNCRKLLSKIPVLCRNLEQLFVISQKHSYPYRNFWINFVFYRMDTRHGYDYWEHYPWDQTGRWNRTVKLYSNRTEG